jgi:adenine-specific DNA-methyltransferase
VAMPPIHDIWQGDSVELCKRFQAKRKVNCVITDPPFGVNNQSRSAVTSAGKANARKIANDATPEEAIEVFDRVMDELLPATVDNADLYIFTSYQVLQRWLDVADRLSRHGFYQKALLVWVKDGPGMGNLEYWGMGYEFILYLKKGMRERTGPRRSGILHFSQVVAGKLIHPHEKPEALLQELMRFSTDKGDFIVDPFSGSGSLVRAARAIDRNCIGIELDELNYSVSKAKLDSTDLVDVF